MVLFISNNYIEKIRSRHRVTLMNAVSQQNKAPISEIFPLSSIAQSVVYQTFMERSFQYRIYSPRKNNHIILNFLSIFRHRVTLSIFTTILLWLIQKDSIFSEVVGKAEIHHSKKQMIFVAHLLHKKTR